MIAATDIDRIIGSEAVDQDNDKIGKVSQVYLDSDSERPTWATLKTGLFGTSETLVPLDDADWDDGTLRLAVDKARVKGAPRVEPDAEISVDEQQRLYAYYGFAADHHDDDGRGTSDRRMDDDAQTRGDGGEAQRNRMETLPLATPPGDGGDERGEDRAQDRSAGGAHVVAAADDGRRDRDDDIDDGDSISYSRSDNDTSDLDRGIDAGNGSDERPSTGVVGTAADRTLGGRGTGDERQQQGEVRLRRYVIVEETVVVPNDGSDDAR